MADAGSSGAVQRTTGAGGARRAAPKRRPAPAGGASQRGARGGKRLGTLPFPAAFRWARVLLLVAAVVVGLPLAHAMFGEVVALLGGACLLGFLLGRWTAPG